MISQDDFIRVVRDELMLPLADSDLENNFDQTVNWRSVHLVRLVVALEEMGVPRVPLGSLFKERTARGVYRLFTASATTRQGK